MENKCPDETAHVQDDVHPHNFHMLEGTFSFDVAHTVSSEFVKWETKVRYDRVNVQTDLRLHSPQGQ